MNKKRLLKIAIIVLIIIHLLTIYHFGFNLIRNVRLVKANGKMYFLYPLGNDCKLCEIDNVFFPKELSCEFIKDSDCDIQELKNNAINISSIYRIIQFSELILIVVLIFYYKKEDNEHYIRNYKL